MHTKKLVCRLGLGCVAAGALVLGLLPAATADDTYWRPADGRLGLHGHGYGHGRGMSQYGAYAAAQRGLSWKQILDFYYPDTALGSAGGRMRVLITDDTTKDLKVSPARRLWLRDLADGKTWWLQKPTASTDRWALRVNKDNQVFVTYRDQQGWHHWAVPGRGHLKGEGQFQAYEPLTLWVPGRNGDVPRHYREQLRTAKPSPGSTDRNTVNAVSLGKYLQGVVASEMPASWDPDALRAQAVAARTYAVRQRSAHAGRYYHVDDTIRYQVYRGVDAERGSSNQAIGDTAGRTVTYDGAPALTEFSSSSGGWTAGSGLPYQQVKRDPYDTTANPNHDWQQAANVSRLERAYPALGRLQRVVVTDRNGAGQWGGRIERATLVGSRDSRTVSGNDLRRLWSLRSRWFAADPTSIISYWRGIGGPGSVVGRPLAAERYAGGSSDAQKQAFQHGRIYHTPSTGAHEMHGALLAGYDRAHGAAGPLGFPTTDSYGRAGGNPDAAKQATEHGRIYWTEPTGAHGLYGPVLGAYDRTRGAAGALGFPTTDIRGRAGGNPRAQKLSTEGGRIYWSQRTGAHAVYGALLVAYDREHGAAGALGFPTTDLYGRAGGNPDAAKQGYQRGRTYWTSSTGAHALYGPVLSAFDRTRGAAGPLGFPTTDLYDRAGGNPDAQKQATEHGRIYWTEPTGAHALYGPVLGAYDRNHGAAGPLGFPTTDIRSVTDGQRMDFQGGWITWNRRTGETTVHRD